MEAPGYAAAGRGLEIEIASFLDELGAAGYLPHARAQRRSILLAFARWTRGKRLAVADLGEVHLATFLKRRSRGPETRKKERATVRRFFAHLRRRGLLPPTISRAIFTDILDSCERVLVMQARQGAATRKQR